MCDFISLQNNFALVPVIFMDTTTANVTGGKFAWHFLAKLYFFLQMKSNSSVRGDFPITIPLDVVLWIWLSKCWAQSKFHGGVSMYSTWYVALHAINRS